MPEGPDFGALKHGDSAAWRAAFAHFWPVALRAAHHPQAALVPWEREEVAHEAMLDWIDHFHKVANLDEAKALLITITYRRAISAARRKYAAKRCVRPENGERSPGQAFADPEQVCVVERSEITLLLKNALDALDTDTRVLLMEKIQRDLTYEEISRQHRIPLGTACTKVARGLKKMREHLEQNPRLMKELRLYLR